MAVLRAPSPGDPVISVEEFVERICLIGAAKGPRRFPRKRRDRQIVTKSILMTLDSARTYSELEINEAIQRWNVEVAPEISTDHVSVRRTLIDYGYLERTASGKKYRVGFPPGPVAFDLEIDDIDIRATVAAYRDQMERRAQERAKRRSTDG